MTIIAATSVNRGSQPGESHGGVYLVDLAGRARRAGAGLDAADHRLGGCTAGAGDCAAWRCTTSGCSSPERKNCSSSRRDFELRGVHSSPYLGQAQAVAAFDGRFYVVSAAYDAVLAFDLDSGRFRLGSANRG